MKFTLVSVFLLMSFSIHAGPYIAGSLGNTKVLGDDPGVKDRITGNSFAVTIGQHISFLAGELFYRSQSADGTVTFNGGTTATAIDMDTKIMGGGIRLFLSFLSLFGGYATYDMDTSATQNGTPITSFPLNGSYDGAYWGLGLKMGVAKFDLFADLIIFDLKSTAFQNVELGLRYHF